jgi:hypothetical protein
MARIAHPAKGRIYPEHVFVAVDSQVRALLDVLAACHHPKIKPPLPIGRVTLE